MQRLQNKKLFHFSLAVFMAVSGLAVLVHSQYVHATALGETTVRFDRMTTGQFTSGMVCAKPSVTNLAMTEGKVLVTFPTGFVVSGTASNWTVDVATTTSWPTGASAWPGIGTATSASGQVVTFPSSDLTSSSTLYCFNWTNTSAALQTPGSTGTNELGTVATQTAASAAIDSSQYATATVTPDQIGVSATVPSAFNFALGSSSDSFGTLTANTVTPSASAISATVNTNAKNGWLVWAKDLNAGIKSTIANYTVASDCSSGVGANSTLSTSAEGYNLGITSSSQTGGTGTLDVGATGNYNFYGNAAGKGGGLCTTFQAIAASNGTANNAVINFKNNINVVGSTPAAADYADTITVVGAGLF